MSIWSSDSSIARYRYERFPLTLFVPVILFLAIPILVAGEAAARAKALTTLLVLLFQFRLWDDLSDLKTDRLEFPERVLSRASSLTSFRWLWVAATGVVLLLLWGHRDLQLLYLAALLFFFVWYRWLADRAPRALAYHIVLLKYPLFVCVAARIASARVDELLLGTMALVFFTFAVYEPLHDERTHRFKGINVVVAADLVIWVLTSWVVLRNEAGSAIVLSLVGLAFALAAASFRRFRRTRDCTLLGRGVFLLSFLVLLSAYGGRL